MKNRTEKQSATFKEHDSEINVKNMMKANACKLDDNALASVNGGSIVDVGTDNHTYALGQKVRFTNCIAWYSGDFKPDTLEGVIVTLDPKAFSDAPEDYLYEVDYYYDEKYHGIVMIMESHIQAAIG